VLEKITFEKKLGIDSSEKKYQGLKISTVSFFVVLAGALFSLTEFKVIKNILLFAGAAGFISGMVRHFWLMLNKE